MANWTPNTDTKFIFINLTYLIITQHFQSVFFVVDVSGYLKHTPQLDICVLVTFYISNDCFFLLFVSKVFFWKENRSLHLNVLNICRLWWGVGGGGGVTDNRLEIFRN